MANILLIVIVIIYQFQFYFSTRSIPAFYFLLWESVKFYEKEKISSIFFLHSFTKFYVRKTHAIIVTVEEITKRTRKKMLMTNSSRDVSKEFSDTVKN
jgi:hypothetical protein